MTRRSVRELERALEDLEGETRDSSSGLPPLTERKREMLREMFTDLDPEIEEIYETILEREGLGDSTEGES